VLNGFLNGSMDLVAQLPDGRTLLMDYKTNRLGGRSGDNPLSAYDNPTMTVAMLEAHYPLQALIYAVALRRYLVWRQPDVSFDNQWAGVAYLFVRGMAGPDAPVIDGKPYGVFSWRPSAEFIEKADEILSGGTN